MSDKKQPNSPSPQDNALEKRVDVMMDPATPDQPEIAAPKDVSQTPIDVFADPLTAPKVPRGLASKLAASADKVEPTESGQTIKSIVVNDYTDPDAHGSIADIGQAPSTAPLLEDTKEPEPTEPVETTDDQLPPAVENATQDSPDPELDDATTDAAIDDIATLDSDELLAAHDDASEEAELATVTRAKDRNGKSLFKRRMFWIVLILLCLAGVFGVPASRYKVAGLVLKQPLQVTILDSTTKKPVSDAKITIDGLAAQTDANGKATIKTPVGPHQVAVTKQYYTAGSQASFVGLRSAKPLVINLVATGRQVPIKLVNTITGQAVAGATVNVLSTSAKTDKNGRATIVLPASTKPQKGTISAPDFNQTTVSVVITGSEVAENTFSITPAGKIYFLSNEKGTIDVIKSNLDGTARQTILKGTGKEDPNTTVLLAARDWRYAVLKSQRSSAQASLFIIDGNTDKVTEFDSGDASFTPIGWYNHYFMYDVVRNTVSTAQAGHEVIKSYDAERSQLNQLDQTQAEGPVGSNVYQAFYNFYVVDNLLVYNTQWYSNGGADLATRNNTIRGVQPNGQNKKDFQSLAANGVGYIQAALSGPQEIYYGANNYLDNKTTYYEYSNQSVKTSSEVTQASFNKLYPTYVISPSGKQVFWSELRDGKQAVLTGDANAQSPKQLANLPGYSSYGWYGDKYLLVTKNSSELYIVSSTGSAAPIKITDYYKPAQGINGYGYGYGGL